MKKYLISLPNEATKHAIKRLRTKYRDSRQVQKNHLNTIEVTLPEAERKVVEDHYKSVTNILEYGSGGSTWIASQLPNKTITAVESDFLWTKSLSSAILSQNPQSIPKIISVDIGHTGEWGRPMESVYWNKYIDYAIAPWQDSIAPHPDVILIDGRFRTACFATALLQITKPTTILFDDYIRDHYKKVEKFVAPTEVIGRLAIFHIDPINFEEIIWPDFLGLFFNTSDKDREVSEMKSNAIIESLKKYNEKKDIEATAMRTKISTSTSALTRSSAQLSFKESEIAELKKKQQRLEKRINKLKRISFILSIPYLVLTLPISAPLAILYSYKKKQLKARKKGLHKSTAKPLIELKKRKLNQSAPVLIWCPIATCGLTTQLDQLCRILKNCGIEYRISYHVNPDIDHPELENWINPSEIKKPTVVFFMERYVPFENGFEEAFQVFYINLDWLKLESISLARVHADVILCPVKYRLSEIEGLFPNSKTIHLPWPSAFKNNDRSSEIKDDTHSNENPIQILYMGNDYNESSRKSPFATVDAILQCDRNDLLFTLKFRSKIPKKVKGALIAKSNVKQVIDEAIPDSKIEDLYRDSDINLIPNESEGNGLSIIEAFSKSVVPAVLDGFPMKDIVTSENGYLINCKEDGAKGFTTNYKTDASSILELLNSLTFSGVDKRREAIQKSSDELQKRQNHLEDVVYSVLHTAGLGSKSNFLDKKRVDLTLNWLSEERVYDIDSIFSLPSISMFKEPQHIDVYMTTSKRPEHFKESLDRIVQAVDQSPYNHRIFISVDSMDDDTNKVIQVYRDSISEVLLTNDQMGLPYHWNMILDRSRATIARSELRPDYICYIQDDCLVINPATYFQEMVEASNIVSPDKLGFVSGYHSSVHAGLAEVYLNEKNYILSKSIDGKNFMARPKVLHSIGKLTWWFPDGSRRGNPGPVRGSHFDLWQWQESPNSTFQQGRLNIVVPDLCEHIAPSREDSTWDNDTTESAIRKRVMEGRIYR